MDTSFARNLANSIVPLKDEEWDAFEQYFSFRTLKKNEILWNIGDVCKHLIFINNGLIRLYYYTNGKEIINQFIFENQFLLDYYSFVTQKPCTIIYSALEETELITIPRPAIYKLYDDYKSYERLGRIIAEQNFIDIHDNMVKMKGISPEEKYRDLVNERPNVIQRVPLYMIASYLNMTPEHLSRIRKKILSK